MPGVEPCTYKLHYWAPVSSGPDGEVIRDIDNWNSYGRHVVMIASESRSPEEVGQIRGLVV